MCTRSCPFLCDYQYLRIGHQYLRINSVGCWVALARRREVRLEARKRKGKGRGIAFEHVTEVWAGVWAGTSAGMRAGAGIGAGARAGPALPHAPPYAA